MKIAIKKFVEEISNQGKMSGSKKRKIDENNETHRTFLSAKQKYELLLENARGFSQRIRIFFCQN
jgi:hypothetical protein